MRDKGQFLRAVAGIEGVYVPGFYRPTYNEDGTFASLQPPLETGLPLQIKKRVVVGFNEATFPPAKFVVPFVDVVHDRAIAEIMRGCTRGCRFARQA